MYKRQVEYGSFLMRQAHGVVLRFPNPNPSPGPNEAALDEKHAALARPRTQRCEHEAQASCRLAGRFEVWSTSHKLLVSGTLPADERSLRT